MVSCCTGAQGPRSQYPRAFQRHYRCLFPVDKNTRSWSCSLPHLSQPLHVAVKGPPRHACNRYLARAGPNAVRSTLCACIELCTRRTCVACLPAPLQVAGVAARGRPRRSGGGCRDGEERRSKVRRKRHAGCAGAPRLSAFVHCRYCGTMAARVTRKGCSWQACARPVPSFCVTMCMRAAAPWWYMPSDLHMARMHLKDSPAVCHWVPH